MVAVMVSVVVMAGWLLELHLEGQVRIDGTIKFLPGGRLGRDHRSGDAIFTHEDTQVIGGVSRSLMHAGFVSTNGCQEVRIELLGLL
jgi:hypothetical protein